MEQKQRTQTESVRDGPFLQQLVSDWRPLRTLWKRMFTIQRVWVVRSAILLVILVAIGYAFDQTVWDWLKLMIIPAVIAGGPFGLTSANRCVSKSRSPPWRT